MALLTAFAVLPFVVALFGWVFRTAYSKQLPPIVLHNIGQAQALSIVGDFVLSENDTDFGFPSGFFTIPKPDRVDADLASGTITVREELLRGSSGFFDLLRRLYYWAVRAIANIAGDGDGFGCFIAVLVGGLILLPAPFLLYAGIAEAALRFAFRSNVRLSAERSGSDTSVHVVLRGLSALSIADELQRAFRTAELPQRFRGFVSEAAPESPVAEGAVA